MRTFTTILAALATAISGLAWLPFMLDGLDQTSGGLVIFLSFFGGTGAVFMGLNVLLHAALVRVRRGPGFVDWVRPGDCTSFGRWLACEWSFFGEGGRQEGLRFCGFELAFTGRLA